MNELSCEMCGSNSIIKQDGLYVCQTCGTKYSVEEARNLFADGTVKIDKSSETENFKILANRYYSNGEYDKAEEYFNKCLELDPSDWESTYYKGLSAGYQSTFSNSRISEAVNGAYNAINLVNQTERDNKIELFRTEIINLLIMHQKNVMSIYANNSNQMTEGDISEFLTANMELVTDTEALLNAFPPTNVQIDDPVYNAYEMIIYCCNTLMGSYRYVWGYDMHTTKNEYKQFIVNSETENFAKAKKQEYTQKIQMLVPTYQPPKGNSTSYCYVATSVYGSYNCPEVWTLRRFRDQKLSKSLFGRIFIKCYYSTSPILVKYFGNTKMFKNFFKPKLDKFVKKLQKEGYKSTFYLGE